MKKSALILALCLGIAAPGMAASLKPTFENPYKVFFDEGSGTYRPYTQADAQAGLKSYGRVLAEEALAAVMTKLADSSITDSERAALNAAVEEAQTQIEEATLEQQSIAALGENLTAAQEDEIVEANQNLLLVETPSGTIVTP